MTSRQSVCNNLRLMRKAAKRLRIVLKDGAARMKHLQEEGTDLELLIGFCWYTDLVAAWVDFVALHGRIYKTGNNAILRSIFWMYNKVETLGVFELIDHLRNIDMEIKRFDKTIKILSDSCDCNTEALGDSAPTLIKTRGLWKMSDYDYGIEVPEMDCVCVIKDGKLTLGEFSELADNPARRCGSQLLMAYKNLIEKMTPIVVQFQFQQLFDRNCNLIQAVYNAEIERVA